MIEPSLREHVASDGYRLKFRHWAPVHPRGIVIALHGMQSHSGWYDYSSRCLADAGFAVYFPDRRGSGLNGFQRGHAAHAMRLANDVRALRALAINETVVGTVNSNAQLPITILGISSIASRCCIRASLPKSGQPGRSVYDSIWHAHLKS